MQKTRRALLTILFVLIILIFFVGAFTQTSWFRNIVRSQIENLVEKNTHGKISLGEISGNFITGFTIRNVHLKLIGSDSTDIISADELYTRYSLWQLLTGKDIAVTSVTIRKPKIYLTKTLGDSLWNYEHLLASSSPTQTPSSPFNLTIDLQNLRIEDGSLSMIDHNSSSKTNVLISKERPIDWSNISLQNLNLDMRAHIQGEKIQQVRIENLSFNELNTPFMLHHLELNADRNDIHTEISNLYLVTDESSIRLSARFDSLYVLHGKDLESLQHSQVKLLLSAQTLSAKELRQFIPELGFMNGNLSLDLDASGEFGKLNIRKGKIGFRNEGNISFSGKVNNLHAPKNLYLDVSLKGNNLSDRTLRGYVPGLGISDLKRYGVLNIEKLTFVGPPNNFKSDFDLHTSNGNVKGSTAFDLRSSQMIYDVKLITQNVNLAQIVGDPSLKGDLNISLSVKGKGTNPKTMSAVYTIDGTGTTGFRNYQISKLHLGGGISNGKLFAESTDLILTSGATLHSDYASFDLLGKTITYDFDVATSDLPVTEFVPIFPPASRVSVEANVKGEGLSPNNIVGSFTAEISGLEQNKKPLPNIVINATLDREQGPERRRIDIVTSSIADLTFRGKYNIETLGKIISDRIQNVSNAIAKRGKDSVRISTILSSCTDSVDLTYTVNIKDLRPVAPFIPNIILLGSGKLNGSVIGCENGQLAFHTDGDIHNFLMRQRFPLTDSSGLPRLRLKDTKFSFSAENIGVDEYALLHSMKVEFKLQSDSILKFSGIQIEKPDADISLSGGELQYKVNAILAQSLGIAVKGTGNMNSPDLRFQADSLSLAFGKSFVWKNDRPSHLTIAEDGSIDLDTLSLMIPKPGYDPENKFAQRIKLGFRIKQDSVIYAYLETPQLDLGDVPKFFSEWTSAPELNKMSGRVSKMKASMFGSLSHPNISADLSLRNFSYNDVTIDSGRVHLIYKEQTLSGNAVLHVDTADFSNKSIREGRENFLASGNNSFSLYIDSIPFLFSLKKYPGYSADSAAVSKRQISIRASAKDYPIDMFSPFVPVVADLHGLSEIALTINGTRDNILYKGTVDIRKGTFLLPTTNILYDFSGKLLLSNDEMKFVDMNLANLPSDDADGRATLNGSFYFKGFVVDSFRLALATNRLTVLSEASKETLKIIYGPLAIRAEGDPILFAGTFDKPKLSGHIGIVQGFLTLPQSDASSANLLNDGITYRIKKEDEPLDTMQHKATTDSLVQKMKELIGEKNTTEYNDTVFEKAVQEVAPDSSKHSAFTQFTPEQLSFQDKMLYDLHIFIPGNLWFTINLSKLYGLFPMKLVAEIKTNDNLSYTRKVAGDNPKVSGVIAVTDKSSFSFIKDFSPVTGTITFIDGLSDPILNIDAEYTGLHKTSSGGDETIKIKLGVTGTPSDNRITMELYRKNSQGDFLKDSRADDPVRSDVLTYLATGNFASDVPSTNSGSLANAPLSVASQLASGAVNSALSSTFLKDYFRSFGVEYVGAQTATKLKLSGGYKDFVVSYGGTYNSGILSNNNITVELPFSALFTFSGARNFLFLGESHLGSSADPTSQTITQPPLFLFRILHRFGP